MAVFFPWFLADIPPAGPLPTVFVGLLGGSFLFSPKLGKSPFIFCAYKAISSCGFPRTPQLLGVASVCGAAWRLAWQMGHLPDPGPRPGRCPSASTSRPPARSAFYPPACCGAAAASARRGRGRPPRPARAAGWGWGSRSRRPGCNRRAPAPAGTRGTSRTRGAPAPRPAAAPPPPPPRPAAGRPPAPSPSPPRSAREAGPAPAARGWPASAAAWSRRSCRGSARLGTPLPWPRCRRPPPRDASAARWRTAVGTGRAGVWLCACRGGRRRGVPLGVSEERGPRPPVPLGASWGCRPAGPTPLYPGPGAGFGFVCEFGACRRGPAATRRQRGGGGRARRPAPGTRHPAGRAHDSVLLLNIWKGTFNRNPEFKKTNTSCLLQLPAREVLGPVTRVSGFSVLVALEACSERREALRRRWAQVMGVVRSQ